MAHTVSAITGALPPPPGVTPNFVDPVTSLTRSEGVNVFLVVLATITTSIYVFLRYFIYKQSFWTIDNLLPAYCGFVTYYALYEYRNTFGADRHQWDVPTTDLYGLAYWAWVMQWYYFISIALIRTAVCLQFKRLFVVDVGYRTGRFWTITAFIAINVAYYAAMLFVHAFQCVPVEKIWKPTLPGHCLNSELRDLYIANGCFNLAGDVLMLAFPLYCICDWPSSWKKRLGVCGLFLVGMLGLAASLLRVVFSITYSGSRDNVFTETELSECTFGELCAGILIATFIWLPGFFTTVTEGVKTWAAKRSSRWSDTTSATRVDSNEPAVMRIEAKSKC